MKEQTKKRLHALSVTSLMVGATAMGVISSDPVQAAMVDGFLRVDGIPGDSQDSKHKNEIDVISYSHTFSPTGETCGIMKITKNLDSASPRFAALATQGAAIPNMVLTLRKAGKGMQDFYKVTLNNVVVLGSEFSMLMGNVPVETVSLKLKSGIIEYRPMRPDGSLGNPVQQPLTCSSASSAPPKMRY